MRDTHNRLHIEKPKPLTAIQKIFDDRITDWIEDGMNLNHQRAIHRGKYRKKICTKCSNEQQKKRSCLKYTIAGKALQSCSHMENALIQKFRDKARIHAEANPGSLRMKAKYDHTHNLNP